MAQEWRCGIRCRKDPIRRCEDHAARSRWKRGVAGPCCLRQEVCSNVWVRVDAWFSPWRAKPPTWPKVGRRCHVCRIRVPGFRACWHSRFQSVHCGLLTI